MALTRVDTGLQSFPDFNRNQQLANAQIYIGVPGLDPSVLANQYQAYVVQENGTQVPVPQPIRTSAGGVPTYLGSPAQIGINEASYSFKVLNSSGSQIYYIPDSSDMANYATNASAVLYDPAGIGAVATTVEKHLNNQAISVFNYFTEAQIADVKARTLTLDLSAALQIAINTGKSLIFPEGAYSAAGLTQSVNGQQFIGLGNVEIYRRSGGVLLGSSGRAVVARHISFRGDSAGAGDCLVYTGDNPVFDHCSAWTNTGYALWSKGNGTRITGTDDIYYSPDVAGAAIAFGQLGTPTLYGQILGINTSTSSVGVKYLDHSASGIVNCQLNTVDMRDGSAYVDNCRIVGDYIVERSFNAIDNCTISGNVTLGDGTTLSGIGFGSNVFMQSGSTITINTGIRESSLHLAQVGQGVTVVDNLTGSATDIENSIFTGVRSYTPTWTAASVNPVLNDGTLVGQYVRQGRTVTDSISLTMGASTTFGSGEYSFTGSHTPVSSRKYFGSAVLLDSGTALFIANFRTRADGTKRLNGFTNNAGTGIQQNSPFTWASGDILEFSIGYAVV